MYKTVDELAVLMLTSGSTDSPKAVCLHQGQIISSLRGKSIHHGTVKDDIFLNWIGLDHVANLTEIHLHAVSLGAQQVHVQGANVLAQPFYFLDIIHSQKVTYTFAPNFFLTALIRSLESLTGTHGSPSESLSRPSSHISEGLGTRGKCSSPPHINGQLRLNNVILTD